MQYSNALLIDELTVMGRLPPVGDADADFLDEFQALLAKIDGQINKRDSIRLLQLLGPDDCFGLAWSLIHAAENCSEWPFFSELHGVDPEWVNIIKNRSE